MKFYLVILKCPAHGFEAISIDRGPGTSGLRLTSGKCCGSWKEGRRWVVNPADLIAEVKRYAAAALGEARV